MILVPDTTQIADTLRHAVDSLRILFPHDTLKTYDVGENELLWQQSVVAVLSAFSGALLSFFGTYILFRKQIKAQYELEMKKIEKQHALELEKIGQQSSNQFITSVFNARLEATKNLRKLLIPISRWWGNIDGKYWRCYKSYDEFENFLMQIVDESQSIRDLLSEDVRGAFNKIKDKIKNDRNEIAVWANEQRIQIEDTTKRPALNDKTRKQGMISFEEIQKMMEELGVAIAKDLNVETTDLLKHRPEATQPPSPPK